MKQNFFVSMFSDDTNATSSKRVLMLWIGIVIWTMVHYFVFGRGSGGDSLKETLVMYDFFLIVSLAGIVLSEQFTNTTAKSSNKIEITTTEVKN